MFISEWEIVLRLILSVILGGVIGYERERHNRPAGFRTHILVCAGSALLMMVSAYGFAGHAGPDYHPDPGRIAAGVVTGIGFIGAGTILQQRGSIRGLTTAATIWVVSGVGLAVGIGFYLGSVVTTALALISLLTLRRVERSLFYRRRLKRLVVRAVDQPGLLGRIGLILGEALVNIRKSELSTPEQQDENGKEMVNIEFLVEVPDKLDHKKLCSNLYEVEGVNEIYWEGDPVPGEGHPEGYL